MPDSGLAVVVLAAGQGTRMRSTKAKVLHNLGGLPLIGHVLATAQELGPAYTVVVVRHQRDDVAAVVSDQLPEAIIVDQDDIPGTGRAVEVALSGLPEGFSGKVVVLSADVPMLDAATLRSLVSAHREESNALTILSARLDNPAGFGRIVRDAAGTFESIVEHKDASAEQLAVHEVNAGVYVFDADRLRTALAGIGTDNAQQEKYLTDAAASIRNTGGRIEAVAVNDPWLVAGINDRVQLGAAARELNARVLHRWQVAGVTIYDPASTWIDVNATLAEDVELLPGTQILGATVVAAGATVGPNTTLTDCEVGVNATVTRTDATLAVIGENASVGPFAYLRPGTYVGTDAKIGTFVETKNTTVGAGSKVPHLSYLGDTTVGEHSNVGAGTITANYDGVNKHRTEVGSYVKSGAHNVFVAPVRIGDGAYTGAGTVVRSDVPAGSLAINVAPQRNMAGWVETNRPGTAAAQAAAASGSGEAHDQGTASQD